MLKYVHRLKIDHPEEYQGCKVVIERDQMIIADTFNHGMYPFELTINSH